MEQNAILTTGFRLIKILEILYKKDLTKSEILNFLYKKHKILISKNTLKLDINSLIKAGFEISRGTRAENYKLHLEKNFTMFNLSERDFCILETVKNASIELLSWQDIIKLKNFFTKFSFYTDEKYKEAMKNFKFFNLVQENVLTVLTKCIEKKNCCTVLYDSSSKGRRALLIFPIEFVIKNDKLYVRCYSKGYNSMLTLRADNIKSVKKTRRSFKFKDNPRKVKSLTFQISKNYYERHPLEKIEKIKTKNKENYEIEMSDYDDFFAVQRFLTLGENASNINNKRIKGKVIKSLEQTLELYK